MEGWDKFTLEQPVRTFSHRRFTTVSTNNRSSRTTSDKCTSSTNSSSLNSSIDDCQVNLTQLNEDAFVTAKEIEVYFYLFLLLIATCLNVKLLLTSTLTPKKSVRSELLYPKMVVLAIVDLIPVLATVIGHLDHVLPVSYNSMASKELYQVLFCKMPVFLHLACSFVSTWTVVTLAAERYLAIRFPLAFVQFMNKRTAYLAVGTLVLVAVVISIPKLLTVSVFVYSHNVAVCDTRTDNARLYQLDVVYSEILFALGTVLPVLVLTVFSALLILEVRKAVQRSARLQAGQCGASFQQAARLSNFGTMVILALALVYTLLQVPDIVLWSKSRLAGGVNKTVCQILAFAVLHTYLSMLSSLVAITNPAILLCFRFCCGRQSQSRSNSSTSAFVRRSNMLVWPTGESSHL